MTTLKIKIQNKLFRIYFFVLEKVSFKKFGKSFAVNIPGATSYQPVDALNFLRTIENVSNIYKNFYDIGCGGGKALWLAQKLGRFSSITGIDGDENLIDLAKRNLEKILNYI